MIGLDKLSNRLRRQNAMVTVGVDRHAAAAVPRPEALVTWVLATWTALSGCCLLFVQNDLSGLLAGGLADRAGQRLLGVNLLVLAATYGLVAARRQVYTVLGWLPLASQTAIAFVVALEFLTGDRSFGWSAPMLIASTTFALLLAGFRLADQPNSINQYAGSVAVPRQEWHALSGRLDPAIQPLGEMPTERLGPIPSADAKRPPAGATSTHRAETPPDDSVLGI